MAGPNGAKGKRDLRNLVSAQMSSTLFTISGANVPLTKIGEVLVQVGMITLHLQARVRLHDQLAGPPLAETASPIARSANETRANLAAMSRYCLQNLVPRTQGLVAQLESISSAVTVLATTNGSDLRGGMNSVAAQIDRCCHALRGYARSWPRSAGMMRLSEQRLWGALAAELHRIEGTDGPIMRSCGEVERMAFDIGQAIDDHLGMPGDIPLQQRCDTSIGLICAASQVQTSAQVADGVGQAIPGMAMRLELLQREQERLADVPGQITRALSLATQASAQSALASRLRDALCDLENRLALLALDYRAQARLADRPAQRREILAQLDSDSAIWRIAMTEVAKPIELGSELSEYAGEMTFMARKEAGFASMIPA